MHWSELEAARPGLAELGRERNHLHSPADPAITPGWVKRRRCDHVRIPSMGKKQGKHKQHDADDPAPAGTLQSYTAQRQSR
jgi:hypothetical protein